MSVLPVPESQQIRAYSSNSVSWYVRGAYKRRCFLRRSKKAPTSTAASTIHGTNVDTKAEMDDGPPRLLPARDDVLGSDIVGKRNASRCVFLGIRSASFVRKSS